MSSQVFSSICLTYAPFSYIPYNAQALTNRLSVQQIADSGTNGDYEQQTVLCRTMMRVLAQALSTRQSRQTLPFYQHHNRELYALFSEVGGSTETFLMINDDGKF